MSGWVRDVPRPFSLAIFTFNSNLDTVVYTDLSNVVGHKKRKHTSSVVKVVVAAIFVQLFTRPEGVQVPLESTVEARPLEAIAYSPIAWGVLLSPVRKATTTPKDQLRWYQL